MSGDQIWRLTSLGRKRAGSIYSKESGDSIISYLHQNRTASINELAGATGKSTASVHALLRKLSRDGLAEDMGGN